MTFNIPELKAFIAIARLGGFTSASAQLHLSQPALSRRIGLIERALGTPLFDRHPDGARLTEAGRAFLPYAEGALATLEDGALAAQETTRGARGSVSLAAIGALCNDAVIASLDQFRRDAPRVDLSLSFHAGTSTEVNDLVLSGAADWGLRFRANTDPRLHEELVGQEKMVIVCSPKHRLARLRSVTAAQLAEETWIAFPTENRNRDGDFWKKLAWYGLAGGRQALSIDSTSAQIRLIVANFGIGLAPGGSVREEIRTRSLRVLNVPEMRSIVPVTLVRRKGAYVSGAGKHLVELLQRAFAAR